MKLDDAMVMIEQRLVKGRGATKSQLAPYEHIQRNIAARGLRADDGGSCFGYGDASLSNDDVATAAEDIQDLFACGHTVISAIVVFDKSYLSEHGIMSFDPNYFGQDIYADTHPEIDLMELRLAVMNGLLGLEGTFFEDMRYVASIEVSRSYVYAHIMMADAGFGGDDARGNAQVKITDTERVLFRRGVESWFVEQEARNVVL